MIVEIGLGLATTTSIVSLYVNWNLMRKTELLETWVETFSDKENIGIWYKNNNQISKIAAIGVRVKKWIAYHGFSININNNLEQYKKIIPCGITDKEVINLIKIKNQDYSKLEEILVEKFILNLKT